MFGLVVDRRFVRFVTETITNKIRFFWWTGVKCVVCVPC